MNFLKSFQGFQKVMTVFAKQGNPAPAPTFVVYFRYAARLAILGLVLFIFVWWPVDAYNTAGFDKWSARMSSLPSEVWYVLLAVLLGWGTTEVVSAKRSTIQYQSYNQTTIDTTDNWELDGQFSNLNDDEDVGPVMDNPSIDEWRNK